MGKIVEVLGVDCRELKLATPLFTSTQKQRLTNYYYLWLMCILVHKEADIREQINTFSIFSLFQCAQLLFSKPINGPLFEN